jgi:hypothetical protein
MLSPKLLAGSRDYWRTLKRQPKRVAVSGKRLTHMESTCHNQGPVDGLPKRYRARWCGAQGRSRSYSKDAA